MESYPAQDAIAPEALKVCQYDACGKVFSKFRSLCQHLKDHHLAPPELMQDHWLHRAMLRERRGGDSKELGFLEFDCVGLSYLADGSVDEARFTCKWCSGRVLAKTTCLKHMTGQHPLHKAEVHTWLTYTDGEKFRKVKKLDGETVQSDRLYLTGAMLRHMAGGASADEASPSGSATGAVQEVPRFLVPTAKQVPKPPPPMAGIPQAPQPAPPMAAAPEVHMPTVTIAPAALSWTAAELDPASRRKTWPIATADGLPLDDFERFMRGGALSEKTIGAAIQGVQYFFSLLHIEGEGFSLTGALVTIYIDNTAAALFDLPVLHTEHSWTRKIVNAVSKLCKFLLLECGRRRWDEAARCIEQLHRESFAQRLKVLSKQKKVESILRRQHDSERLSKLPPVPEMKEAVRLAMIDLRFISLHAIGLDTVPDRLHSAATAAMVGILWFNGFAGRSKEWELMSMDAIREAFSSNRDYLVCAIHKTAATYGDLGKHLSPGTKAAIADYIDLPRGGRDTGKFLQPGPRAKSGKVSVHTCLRTFCAVYLADYEVPGTTLLRKWYHSGIKNDEQKAMQLVARLDGHSHKIAEEVYAVSTPLQDAEKAKHLVDVMLGGPVGPLGPSDTECFCFEDVLERFGIEVEGYSGVQPISPEDSDDSASSASSSTSSSSASSTSSSSSSSEAEPNGSRPGDPASSSQPPSKQARRN